MGCYNSIFIIWVETDDGVVGVDRSPPNLEANNETRGHAEIFRIFKRELALKSLQGHRK